MAEPRRCANRLIFPFGAGSLAEKRNSLSHFGLADLSPIWDRPGRFREKIRNMD